MVYDHETWIAHQLTKVGALIVLFPVIPFVVFHIAPHPALTGEQCGKLAWSQNTSRVITARV